MTEEQLEEEQSAELLVKICQENQTRKALAIMNECAALDEAKMRVRELLPA